MNHLIAREKFLNYFIQHGHTHVHSSSLIPNDDPTLLFTNSGMVQFKKVFLGEDTRNYNRATTIQKCIRAGGKHNDLENVGYTARHHTFFEMLGNFSFGNYFKEQAIEFAWNFLVNEYQLPTEKLWVSIYKRDDEAYEIWSQRIGIPEHRIVRLGKKENFWTMGETGPCGPCSEIHIDRGEKFSCNRVDCNVDCECDRFLEIWNLVFMQFNRNIKGDLIPLPNPSIDTGMGLERILSVLQNVNTNFDIDLFTPIISSIENISGKEYCDPSNSIAIKVIADHIRSTSFLINDSVLPSNEGKGYVLRRIIRRALRYGRSLGLKKPFLCQIADSVFTTMKPVYPQLFEKRIYINKIIQKEEERFSKTLDIGLTILNDKIQNLEAKNDSSISGDFIFKLYDTYGFPIDIVKDVVRDRNIELDISGFKKSMKNQKEQSRAALHFIEKNKDVNIFSREKIDCNFIGYENLECETEIVLILKNNDNVIEAKTDDSIYIVTKNTTFYPESGGQIGDIGTIIGQSNLQIRIDEVIKNTSGAIFHKGKIISGTVRTGQTVRLTVDNKNRLKTSINHSSTHLLHAALRLIIGNHVHQSGSLVTPDRLRFDFTHYDNISDEKLLHIENAVNEYIRKNIEISTKTMNREKAIRSGAMSIFEDKYGDIVRVVSIGDYSIELCGGTHVKRTGDIGLFKIIDQSSVASGIRRIEALTGQKANEYIHKSLDAINRVSVILKSKTHDMESKIANIIKRNKALEKELLMLKSKKLTQNNHFTGDNDLKQINGVLVLTKYMQSHSFSVLKKMIDQFKKQFDNGIFFLGCENNGKAHLFVGVSDRLKGRFDAVRIVRNLAPIIGGNKGGGRPDMAQTGGNLPDNIKVALKKGFDIVEKDSFVTA